MYINHICYRLSSENKTLFFKLCRTRMRWIKFQFKNPSPFHVTTFKCISKIKCMYIYHSRQEIVNFGECNYKCWNNNTQVCVLLYKTKIKYTLGILLEHSSCPWHLEHLWLACTLRSESKDTIKKLYICIYKVIPNLKIQIYNFAFFMLFI